LNDAPRERLHRLSGGRHADREAVEEEVRFHLERKVEKLMAGGMSEEAARKEALRRFGDVEAVKSALERESERREAKMRMTDRVDGLRQDVTYAVRQLTRSPGFTFVTVATLTLGIGATTAIFSVVDGILFRPLPYEEPQELVRVWADWSDRGGPDNEWPNFPNLWNLRERSRSFESLAIWMGGGGTVTGLGAAERVVGTRVDHHLFADVLRVEPAIGRGFLPDDDRPGAAATVLLSHGFWQRAYAGDPSVLGSALTLNGDPYTIIGVMPEDFRPSFAAGTELWTTLRMDIADHACGRGNACLFGIARLADGVPLETARAEADEIGRRQAEEDPEANAGTSWAILSLQDDLVGPARDGLLVLMGAAVCVLLIACVNQANLLLARGTSRRAELAVRSAVGAGQRRIVAQLLTESVVLALLGGAVGIAGAYLLTDALVTLAPAGTPRIEEVSVDGRVLAFAGAVTVAAGLVFGLFPALRTAGGRLHDTLREGGRAGGAAGGVRARNVMVGAQVALALVLLVGSGLLLRSLSNLRAVSLGFDPEGVLAFQVSLPPARYDDGAALYSFHSVLEERLGALPGVASVGATSNLPLAGFDGDASFTIEGRPVPPPEQSQAVWFRRVTPELLGTLRIPVVRGRGILPSDDAQAPRVVVINETFAARYFPDQDPIGQRLNFNDPANPVWWDIVGVAGDVKHFGLRGGGERVALYTAYQRAPPRTMFVVLRSERDLAALAGEVRATLAELDADLAAARLEPLDRYVSGALGAERFLSGLLTMFAAVALLLAVVGLYGVVSYSVNSRLREMGVRLAMGASGGAVGSRVVLGSLGVVGVGLAVGGVVAVALTPLMESLLFEVSATDPFTFAAVAVALTAAAALAATLPAVRAARVDPVEILRTE
jgi:predicted permease